VRSLLIITTSYPSQGEGEAAAGAFVRDFALAVAALGVSVTVVAPALVASCGSESGVWVDRFAVPRLPLSQLKPLRPADWLAIYRTLRGGSAAVDRLCRERRPDHLLALWALPSGGWARRAARRYGIAYSTWALGSDIWTLGKIPLLRNYLAAVMAEAQHRYADGYQLAADVTAICHQPCRFLASSRYFGHGQPLSPNLSLPYRLAYLGRWHPNKGVDLLLAALEALDEASWMAIEEIRIYGGGPLQEEITAAATRLQQQGRSVKLGGYLDLVGARQLLAWCHYLIIPSRIESIPVIFSDAMQAQRPVIATPVGDLPRLLQSYQCGVAAAAVDAPSIAAAIRVALHHSPASFNNSVARAAEAFAIEESAATLLRDIA
jgi:glycosyltransferase involved in cell wall biosynthesis